MALSVVILAAGQGKRMASDLPKVLQPLAGRPLLAHVIDTARSLQPAAIHVVHGHGAERVRAAFPEPDLRWVLQAEQRGTGHAVAQAMPDIPDDHTVLVLYGDVPLIRGESLRALVARSGPKSLALLSAVLPDPAGYGRVIRDGGGRVVRIVEHKDANHKELAIAEVNTGLLAAPAVRLRAWLAALKPDNAQSEYYLTDCIGAAVRDGCAVEAVIADTAAEVLGVNDKLQLAEVEAAHRKERATELMRAGVTTVDPLRVDIRGEVGACARRRARDQRDPRGQVKLGDRVRSAGLRAARPRVGADTGARPQRHRGRRDRRALHRRPVRAPAPGHEARGCRAHRQFRRGEEQRARRRQQGQPPELCR
jgi:bifunctional UDP-N-acetylglucosamine pyrophosphorylase/glucosamine-1-phosphate N-acetyltransferase